MNRDENKYANVIDRGRGIQLAHYLPDASSGVLGVAQLDWEWLDLNALILDVIARLHPYATNCSVHLHLAHVLPLFFGDRRKLTLALVALFGRAIKASSLCREIIIASLFAGQRMHIHVWETGGSEDGCSDPFALWDFTVLDDIARMHGGLAWVERTPRLGSIFHLTLRLSSHSR